MNKNNKQRLISVVAIMAATLIASGVLGMIASAKPAHAAFPGSAGHIAFVSDRSGYFNIYRMSADGFGPTQLTPDSSYPWWSYTSEPAWSPNGTKIAYSSHRSSAFGDSYYEIRVMNADGSGVPELATDSLDNANTVYSNPAFYPNGKNKIVYEDSSTGGGDLYSIFESTYGNYNIKNVTRLTKSKFEETAPAPPTRVQPTKT